MPNPKVEQYSRDVIAAYRNMAGSEDERLARAITIGASAQAASDSGQFTASRASSMAKSSIDTFREKTYSGMEPREAAKVTAKEMSERYDSRGLEIRKDRDRSNGLGI